MNIRNKTLYVIVIITVSLKVFSQSVSSGVVELRVPIWSLINLNERDLRDETKKFIIKLIITTIIQVRKLPLNLKMVIHVLLKFPEFRITNY